MSEEPDIDTSELTDEHDVESKEGEDNGYSIALYRAEDGSHFIYIVQSGMSSKYDGALGFDQWVADDQIAKWKDL